MQVESENTTSNGALTTTLLDDPEAQPYMSPALQLVDSTEYDTIRRTIERMKSQEGQVFEVRAIDVPQAYGSPATFSGYYDDYDRMAIDICGLEQEYRPPAIWCTLNPVYPDLLCWADNCLVKWPAHTTADQHILRRGKLFVDVDTVKVPGVGISDISATDQELEYARTRAREIREYLRDNYIKTEPSLIGMSGNGYHLLYDIDKPNTEKSRDTLEQFLAHLSERFSDQYVEVDETVFNASRMIKIYGTWARKGFHVPRLGRVHRKSYILQENEL